jgi:hypothetical protein
MQIREAGIADRVSSIVDPKNGEQEMSWELNERMEKTYGQPSVAVPDDCKYMGYECLDVSQVWSFLLFLFFPRSLTQMPHNVLLFIFVSIMWPTIALPSPIKFSQLF